MPIVHAAPAPFSGPSTVRASFVPAAFGWGVGFYGPGVFLNEVIVRTGWSLTLVSSARTPRFLFGAAIIACLPRLHSRVFFRIGGFLAGRKA